MRIYCALSGNGSVSSDDTNDASVGIKLVHGENSFVMCGDASEKSESAMVKEIWKCVGM